MKSYYSIKREFLYLGLLFSIIFFLVMGSLFSIPLFSISKESANRMLKGTNMEISAFIEGYFTEITNTIEVLASNSEIINAMSGTEQSRERVLAIYIDFFNANDNITYIYSGYEEGFLLINNYIPEEGYDPTQRPWYTAAMEQRPETSTGLPYQEAITDEWLISQSKALKDEQGNYPGVIAIDCSLNSIVTLMMEKYLYDSQLTYIINQDGKIIIHPDDSYIGQTIAHLKEEIKGDRGELTYKTDNQIVWGHYNKLETTDWIVVTVVDRWEILQPIIIRILSYTFIAICLAMLLGMVQNKIFGRRFVEPLIYLGKRVAAITEGKPEREGDYRYSNPEIGAIAENIERLAEHSLKKKANELETIIESTGDGILVVGNEHNVIYINTRFCEMWQISKEDVLSSSYTVFIKVVSDQLAEPQAFVEKMEALYAANENDMDTFFFEDGRVYEVFSCPLLEEQQVVGRLWSFRDVTDRNKAEEKLRILATTDELTGLWNRRYFMQAVEQEIERGRRYNQVFSILMIDIDHFKKVNDTLGHAVGDMTLKHIASIIINCLRGVDIMGRLGGEEFAILLPSTSLDDAVTLAERLRQAIEKHPADYNGSNIYFTVSIGVTSNNQGTTDVDEILKKADEALYEAKRSGRNRVVKKL